MKILVLILFIATVGIIGYYIPSYIGYKNTFVDVSFSGTQNDVSVAIHNAFTDEKVASFSDTNAILSLRPGTYYYVAMGDIYAETKVEFVVKGDDTQIKIDPAFSPGHLQAMLDRQTKDDIHSVLKSTYPDVLKKYTIEEGELYQQGQWYGTILSPIIDERDIGDIYRVVLTKQGDSWKIINNPELILTTENYPNVPVDVLHGINDQTV